MFFYAPFPSLLTILRPPCSLSRVFSPLPHGVTLSSRLLARRCSERPTYQSSLRYGYLPLLELEVAREPFRRHNPRQSDGAAVALAPPFRLPSLLTPRRTWRPLGPIPTDNVARSVLDPSSSTFAKNTLVMTQWRFGPLSSLSHASRPLRNLRASRPRRTSSFVLTPHSKNGRSTDRTDGEGRRTNVKKNTDPAPRSFRLFTFLFASLYGLAQQYTNRQGLSGRPWFRVCSTCARGPSPRLRRLLLLLSLSRPRSLYVRPSFFKSKRVLSLAVLTARPCLALPKGAPESSHVALVAFRRPLVASQSGLAQHSDYHGQPSRRR